MNFPLAQCKHQVRTSLLIGQMCLLLLLSVYFLCCQLLHVSDVFLICFCLVGVLGSQHEIDGLSTSGRERVKEFKYL